MNILLAIVLLIALANDKAKTYVFSHEAVKCQIALLHPCYAISSNSASCSHLFNAVNTQVQDDSVNHFVKDDLDMRLVFHRYVLFALLILFFLFHGVLYAFLPQRKENLFFCVTLILSLIMLLILHFQESIMNPATSHTFYWLFLGMMPVCLFSGLLLSHQLWHVPMTRRTIIAWPILFAVIYFIGLLQDNRIWPYATAPIATIEFLRLSFSKNNGRGASPKFLQIGVFLFAAAVVCDAAVYLNAVSFSNSGIVDYLWAYGFIAMLACVSLEIGREFAHATKELEDLTATLETRVHTYAKELEKKSLAQARLETLRFQLNPHFLYNALNSVDALSREKPEDVPLLIQKLCEYLRYSLEVSEDGSTTLQAELDALHCYLGVEKVRYEEQLEVQTDVDPAAKSMKIPELILLPLVENAVKHGMRTSEMPLRIRILARCDEDALRIEVWNTGRLSAGSQCVFDSGIGLSNSRSRLELSYGESQELTINEQDGWVVVKIVIPLD